MAGCVNSVTTRLYVLIGIQSPVFVPSGPPVNLLISASSLLQIVFNCF